MRKGWEEIPEFLMAPGVTAYKHSILTGFDLRESISCLGEKDGYWIMKHCGYQVYLAPVKDNLSIEEIMEKAEKYEVGSVRDEISRLQNRLSRYMEETETIENNQKEEKQ